MLEDALCLIGLVCAVIGTVSGQVWPWPASTACYAFAFGLLRFLRS